jgi:hypothetical protein
MSKYSPNSEYILRKWLSTQIYIYNKSLKGILLKKGKLSFSQKQLLSRIPYITLNSLPTRKKWIERYNELTQFISKYNKLPILTHHKNSSEASLANWLSTQRYRYKCTRLSFIPTSSHMSFLSKQQFQLLNNIPLFLESCNHTKITNNIYKDILEAIKF